MGSRGERMKLWKVDYSSSGGSLIEYSITDDPAKEAHRIITEEIANGKDVIYFTIIKLGADQVNIYEGGKS